VQDALPEAVELRRDGMDGGELQPPAAVGGLDLGVADPHRAAAAGRDQHGAVAVGQELAGAVRPGPECPGPGVGDVARVGVVHVDGPAAQFGAHAERGGADTPQDLVGMVVPGEGQPVLAQRRTVPAGGRATEVGQRHAAVRRVDGHPGQDLAGAVDRRRDDVPGIDLAQGGLGRHGELPPGADVAAVELLGRARRLGPDHGQPPPRLAVEDRPGQRGRAAVAADARVRDPGGRALADHRWYDLLQERAQDHVGGRQPGEPGHVLGRHRGPDLQVLRPDDLVPVSRSAVHRACGMLANLV